jgi:hypothetical protein
MKEAALKWTIWFEFHRGGGNKTQQPACDAIGFLFSKEPKIMKSHPFFLAAEQEVISYNLFL